MKPDVVTKDPSLKNNSNTASENKKVDVNAENKILNLTFNSLTVISLVGFLLKCNSYSTFWENRKDKMPENFVPPSLYDTPITLVFVLLIVAMKMGLEKVSYPLMNRWLDDKYKAKDDESKIEMEKIYTKKASRCFFKVCYFITIVVIGYLILKDVEFFPGELLGNGDLQAFYEKGVYVKEGSLFYTTTTAFKYYYLTSLAFVIVDFIWLVFIYEKQSDYPLMFLHHTVTFSLIFFSYLTNNTHIGCIVMFIHDSSDIVVYITRIVINSKLPDPPKLAVCAWLLITLIYLRLVIYGKMLYITNYYLDNWHIFTNTLFYGLCILYFMHIYWVFSIIKRFFYLKIEDVGTHKKSKTQKDLDEKEKKQE